LSVPPKGKIVVDRLKNRSDFLRAARGVRRAEGGVTLETCSTPIPDRREGHLRVGFTASRKVGNAVVRNRARRRLRAVASQILPLVEQFSYGDRSLYLVAGGRVVNLAAAEGHPAAVMDVSFALQALAAEALVRGSWTPGVHAVPDEIEREVATLKLAALGVNIDELTDAQAQYLSLTSRQRDR